MLLVDLTECGGDVEGTGGSASADERTAQVCQPVPHHRMQPCITVP